MDSMVDWCRANKIPLTEEQIIAENYVRSRGAKFFVDYGYENVVSRADELFNLECEAAMQIGLIQ